MHRTLTVILTTAACLLTAGPLAAASGVSSTPDADCVGLGTAPPTIYVTDLWCPSCLPFQVYCYATISA